MISNLAVEGGKRLQSPVRAREIVAGRYRVDAILGSGGNGVVVAAMHVDLRTRVAIKFFGPEALKDDVAAARLLREARATARIPSEHVAGILDAGTLESGAPYLVMELFDGVDLATLAQERGRIDADEAVGYVLQVCEAVSEAHALGIIHRDLKPSNVFLARDAVGRQSIKVLDFGLAKVIGRRSFDGSLTDSNMVIGSPFYMSPEQMTDSSVIDERTDIWSIGVLLFELLTGQPPFTAASLQQICTPVLHGKPPSFGQLGVIAPEGLEVVVVGCLGKKPGDRLSSVTDLGQALAPFTKVQLGLRSAPSAQFSRARTTRAIANVARSGAIFVGLAATSAFAVATWCAHASQRATERPASLSAIGIGTELSARLASSPTPRKRERPNQSARRLVRRTRERRVRSPCALRARATRIRSSIRILDSMKTAR
jgi:eukaryotic-like serine/threonine-protein kinase